MEGDPSETNTASKRRKLATDFWPVELRNDHLTKEGLQKTEKAMQNALSKEKEDNDWDGSNSSSSGKDHPGGQTTIQLWDEHARFLRALPAYLCYGERRSNNYHCTCSGITKKWQEGINLTLPRKTRCKDDFTGQAHLLNHYTNKKDVYHSGFEEYVRTVTDGAQQY